MKRLFAAYISVFLTILQLSAQEMTLVHGTDSIPAVVSRILEQKGFNREFRNIKSHINLEFAASANAYLTGNSFDEMTFNINRVRLEIYGKLNRQLSYHFRQSFNKYSNPLSVDNLSSSIEYANITWHQSDRFELVAGKQYLRLAGYEGYVNGILVREFSDFNNNVEFYQTGVTGVVNFTPSQSLSLQVVNNRNSADSDTYLYGLPEGVESSKFPLLTTLNWDGKFADGAVHLMYSASVGQVAKGKNVYYLMCGNIYKKGPVLAYLDVLYSRSALDCQQRITTLQGQIRGGLPVTAQNTEYFTVIANVDYSFHPKFNAYVKGVYETAGVYKSTERFAEGHYLTSWNAQACLEWFPFREDKGFKVFAHYLYKGNILTEKADALMASLPDNQRISLGLVYVIPVL